MFVLYCEKQHEIALFWHVFVENILEIVANILEIVNNILEIVARWSG